jgi:2-dehydropantoate 2-reductase
MSAIAVFGAGAVGCWIGGKLAAAGADVTLIGRPRVIAELETHGLIASALDDPRATTHRALRIPATSDARAARSARCVLVTVKSAQTAEAGATLAGVLAEGTVVVSLQNGVRNADVLRATLPGHTVLAAMVPFNVVCRGPGVYHRATAGALCVDDHAAAAELLAACAAAKLPIEARSDMAAVQWGKLVLNLNNAINALSGRPLAEELGQRAYRRCLAAAQREALELLRRARQDVAQLTPVPPRWLPRMLELPDQVFRVLARRLVAIDPAARSSMWDDFERGRATEIDYLQGEVVGLADRLGRAAPVNRALVQLVRVAERGGKRDYGGGELLGALGV